MSLTITINDINNLTDTERAVLRYVLDGVPLTDELCEHQPPAKEYPTVPESLRAPIVTVAPPPVPVEPEEVCSPHTTVVAAPPAPPAPASAELDSAGLPWDKRIHSSSKAKIADGTWRKLRGVDNTLVGTVEAELRMVQAIPVSTAALTPEVQDAPPTPVAPLPPVPQAPVTFADLMKHITPMLVSGKLPQDKVMAIAAEFGLPHLAALGARPDLVAAVKARIDAEVGV